MISSTNLTELNVALDSNDYFHLYFAFGILYSSSSDALAEFSTNENVWSKIHNDKLDPEDR